MAGVDGLPALAGDGCHQPTTLELLCFAEHDIGGEEAPCIAVQTTNFAPPGLVAILVELDCPWAHAAVGTEGVCGERTDGAFVIGHVGGGGSVDWATPYTTNTLQVMDGIKTPMLRIYSLYLVVDSLNDRQERCL
eukprot:TRINITY_DN8552_c0_g1_i1.p4 TRINITY_DN8552_c0_g1~~TRINITY_DN8552_c0_g1_i1.p4  ORF type:complete len:135 (+),score=7.82 TRINITY_DN8552_c0_g1_i1:773-1177(+)